jgi:tetratricopeptide (TPR) repeat protein
MNTWENRHLGLHRCLAEYYEAKANTNTNPKTVGDLAYAIEAFQHIIWAKDYERAYSIYRQKINIQDATGIYLMTQNLGAFELNLSLILQLFPNNDTGRGPFLTLPHEKSWLTNEVGINLSYLGRLVDAVPFFQLYIQMELVNNNWINASMGNRNLYDIQILLGNLTDGEKAIRQSLNLAQQAKSKKRECEALAYCAYALFLQGNNEVAGKLFEQANQLQQKIIPQTTWLFSYRGTRYAEFLIRCEKMELAEEVTKKNLKMVLQLHSINDIISCRRLLARLCLEQKDYSNTEAHLIEGLPIAYNIGLKEELAKIHLEFARLYLVQKYLPQAHSSIKEAMRICTRYSYKLIEIDARNVLAQIHLADNKLELAQKEAQTALNMSITCGYHWGQMDAKNILKNL